VGVGCCLIRHSPVVSFVLHVQKDPQASCELRRIVRFPPAARMLVGEEVGVFQKLGESQPGTNCK
jgi:hypothetical protein